MSATKLRHLSPPSDGSDANPPFPSSGAAESSSAESATTVAGGPAQSTNNVDRSKDINTLVDMGFPPSLASEALKLGDGTVRGAVVWLVAEREHRAGSVEEDKTCGAAGLEAPMRRAEKTASSAAHHLRLLEEMSIEEPSLPDEEELLGSSGSLPKAVAELSRSHHEGTASEPQGRSVPVLTEAGTGTGVSGDRRAVTVPPEQQPGAQHMGRLGASETAPSSREDASVMAPVANAVVAVPEEEFERRSATGEGSAAFSSLLAQTRRLRVAVAVLAVGLIALALAMGLILGGDREDSGVGEETGQEFPGWQGYGTRAPSATQPPLPPTPTPTPSEGPVPTLLPTRPPTHPPTPRLTPVPTPRPTPKSTPDPSPPPTRRPTTPPTTLPSTPPTTLPTTQPTTRSTQQQQPTKPPADILTAEICADLPGTCADLSTEGTPQYEALEWVASDSRFEEYADWRRVQRYVLAVVYLSLEGWEAESVVDWIDGGDDECSWGYTGGSFRPIRCDSLGKVTILDIDNDLVGAGRVPLDVALLADSLERLWFGWVKFSGTIPTELGKLSKLTVLHLGNNNLRGAIPTELGGLTNLARLFLNNNGKLVGSIPSELGLLTKLEELSLDRNDLTGTMPEEVCQLRTPTGQLGSLVADCKEEVQCDCCTACCIDGSLC